MTLPISEDSRFVAVNVVVNQVHRSHEHLSHPLLLVIWLVFNVQFSAYIHYICKYIWNVFVCFFPVLFFSALFFSILSLSFDCVFIHLILLTSINVSKFIVFSCILSEQIEHLYLFVCIWSLTSFPV